MRHLVIPDPLCSRCSSFPRRSTKNSLCKSCHNEDNRRYYKKMPRKDQRAKSLKSKYGLSFEEFQMILHKQEGRCSICMEEVYWDTYTANPKKACVDHCHKTGKIRGILCSNCNRALGLLKDDLSRIKRLEGYLNRCGI